ncbi:MAG: hypothetical protein LBN10_12315 [Propionibacteriaceae bacterium]|jgi:hypothetical protein|nr:hypothetical protein [Propionibacteriaceae bacterium]
MSRIMKGSWIVVTTLAALLFVLSALGNTFSWFVAHDSVTNQLGASQYRFDVSAVDVFAKPDTPVTPGSQIDKTVGAVNSGDLPGFVRLLVLPTVVAADGYTVLPARLGQEVIADFNTTNWADGKDGYFYYLDVLPAGQTTPNLFTTVTLASGLDSAYVGASLKIEVKVEAVGIQKWEYRLGWWGSTAVPSPAPLVTVDLALRGLAK